MEWDLSFATPKQLRRTFGQRRSTGGIYSDEDSMLSSPPFKMLKKMDSSMFSGTYERCTIFFYTNCTYIVHCRMHY